MGRKIPVDLPAAPAQETSRMYKHFYLQWVGEASAQPASIGPNHSHARYGVWPAAARCAAPAVRLEPPPRRSRDRRARNSVDAAVARVRRAAVQSRPPTPGLLASRSGSRRSDEQRAARPSRRRSDECQGMPLRRTKTMHLTHTIAAVAQGWTLSSSMAWPLCDKSHAVRSRADFPRSR
jgi:hypothetical protein